MLASMLSPSPASPSGRISQLLPSVKCSNCNQPVPLAELGDHTCAPPPPVPTLPKPSVTPAAATALLPQRLQSRLPAVGNTTNSPPPQQRPNAPPNGNVKTNTPSGSFQPRSSPLSRGPDDGPSHARTGPRPSADYSRSHTPSNAGSVSSTMGAPRPSFSSLRDGPPPSNSIPINMNGDWPPSRPPVNTQPPPGMRPPPNMQRPVNAQPPPNMQPPTHLQRPSYTQSPPSNLQTPTHIQRPSNNQPPNMQSPTHIQRPSNHQPPPHVQRPSDVQYPSGSMQFPVFNVETPPPMIQYSPRAIDNIDTKTGGAAGMAGIGRRGFAAAARAAMFVASPGSQPQIRRANPPPQFLDLDAAARSATTPPLSAGSGYSSHSPGPLSPSPQAEYSYSQTTKASRTPSPSSQYLSTARVSPGAKPNLADQSLNSISTSPTSVRLPFFEKYKNTISNPSVNLASTNTTTRPISAATRSSMSSYGETPPTRARNLSIDTTAPPLDNQTTPASPSSGSDLGLAYADDTDEDVLSEPRASLKSRVKPPPALQLSLSLNASSSNNHVRFPSTLDYSDDQNGIQVRTPTNKQHIRGGSSSPVSSNTQVLDALQTSPSSGPGVGRRLGRSPSESSSSSGSRSTYSRTTSSGLLRHDTGALERALDTLLEDVGQNIDVIQGPGLSKSKSLRKQPSVSSSSRSGSVRGLESRKPSLDSISVRGVGLDSAAIRAGLESRKTSMDSVNEGLSIMSPGSKTHRSNTIQGTGPQSPESRAPKLPTRSRTSPAMDRDKLLNPESARMRKERVKLPKVCLRCTATIDDGRWVQVDSGGVLCEKCWKNMYLPKCRRCSLPIEKQAVSSSDGQLKGKYHKECFNCHVCHKPFPDKSFYVYDGKPLCAYHYHEANESLCAAARCGQPIEGPCAVSHAGDRYHPEHMTCEHPGYPECRETLKEYWEVDGRMLCERHASGVGSDDEEDDNWVQSSRALKRVTRFIDLAGAGTGGGPGEVEGSELR